MDHRNVQRFRGRIVFKADRLLYHSSLGLRPDLEFDGVHGRAAQLLQRVRALDLHLRDIIDGAVSLVSKAMLGMGVSCPRQKQPS